MKIIECPRDAMQGLKGFIPTAKKADYINTLLKVGFDTIDFGSFVSPKAIPQLKDSAEVLSMLDLAGTNTELLAIIGNEKGGAIASRYPEIKYLGYPHSVSDTFLKVNINSSIEKSQITLDHLLNHCGQCNKELVVYLSMAFGNPYGDVWNEEIIFQAMDSMRKMGIRYISLSDTVGMSTPENISMIFNRVMNEFTDVEIGFHLHTTPDTWKEKIDRAWLAGCRRFDSVINGLGGCPMAQHELVGNLDTANLLEYLNMNQVTHSINSDFFNLAQQKAQQLFN